MTTRSEIALIAWTAGVVVLCTYPTIAAIWHAVKVWLVYVVHLWRVSARRGFKGAVVKSVAMSLLGAGRSLRRDLQFRLRRSNEPDFHLTQVNERATGDVIVLAYGTWGTSEHGHFAHLLNWMARLYRHRRVFVANWRALNDQKARSSAAERLASELQKRLGPGESAYLIGHSHGGSVIAMAAALLPPASVGAVVTLATPFVVISKTTTVRFAADALHAVIALALPFVLGYLFYWWFPFQSFWGWGIAALGALVVTYTFMTEVNNLRTGGRESPTYYRGRNFTAIRVVEDRLNDFMRSVTSMQRSYLALIAKQEVALNRTQPHFLRRVLFSSLLQMMTLTLAVSYTYFQLPAHTTESYDVGVLLGVSMFSSGLACLLCPNPFFEMLGYQSGLMFAGFIRFLPNILMRIVLGIRPGVLSSEVTTISDGRRIAAHFKPLSLGSMQDVHTSMLGHKKVRHAIAKAIR